MGAPAGSRRYHRGFPPADPSLARDPQLADTVAERFCRAVQRQLVSDVEVGSHLSGGMDSGLIVAVAGRSIGRLLTFTGGFDVTNVDGIEQGFDERRLAERLSYLLQTEHYDVVLHAGDMPAAMEKLSWHMDDPRVGMCHPNWYVAKLASRFVKVCLAAAGGDELFGGYPWRYQHSLSAATAKELDDRAFRLLAPFGRRPAICPACSHPKSASTCLPCARVSIRSWRRRRPISRSSASRTTSSSERFHFEWKTFLHGFLISEDRMSMAHGLETRVPFLDNALADLAWRIPPLLKIDTENASSEASGRVESMDGKRILRRAMCRYLPEEFTRQRKQGFSPPDENWYRGPSMDYIKLILFDRQTLDRPWFDQRVLHTRLDEHFEGRKNHRLLIWSLLSFEWLQRHFVNTG